VAKKNKAELRSVRHARVRKRVVGSTERPRLMVYRSLKHIYAQLIDDSVGRTVCSASSLEPGLGASGNVDGAKKIGLVLGQRAKDKGVTRVVFDRGGCQYHGRVASLADGAREAGLEF